MRTFQRGLRSRLAMWPIQRWNSEPSKASRWKSEKWTVRRGALFAVPGTALGYRLPLGSLPYAARRFSLYPPARHQRAA